MTSKKRREPGDEELDVGREADRKQEEFNTAGATGDVATGATPPAPAGAPAKKAPHVEAIGKVARDFLANIPPAAASGGHYEFPPPAEDAEALPVEDGKYRPAGADWVFYFEGGAVREAHKAVPPDFGGPDVVSIEI